MFKQLVEDSKLLFYHLSLTNTDEEYQNGKIYKITSNKTNKIYIGSTVDELNTRLKQHYDYYKLYKKKQFYEVSSFDIIKLDKKASIELIENYSCKTEAELLERQKYYEEKYINKGKNICGYLVVKKK